MLTVTDVEDGSITDFYFDNFFVNLDVVVPYMVTYSATDSGGYTTTFPLTVKVEQLADVLFEKVLNAKITNNYPYLEPSVLSAIKALREPYEVKMPPYNEAKMLNKVKGAWYGRAADCIMGKAVEWIKSDELIPFLKEMGNYPLHQYIYHSDRTEEIIQKYRFFFARGNMSTNLT